MSDREEYTKLRKKYKKLPSWNWIKNNLKLKLDEENRILENIMNAFNERFTFISEILIEPIISGGGDYRSFLERRMFSEKERDKLFELFKETREIFWKSNKIKINEFSEKEYVKWIIEAKTKHEKLTPKVLKLCHKLSKDWKDYKKPDEQTSYHG